MDKTLVIYDLTGRVLSIMYGATETPQGVPFVWCDIPPGAIVDHVDVTTGTVVFEYEPESDLGRMQRNIEAMQETVNAFGGTVSEALQIAQDANTNAEAANGIASSANALAEALSSSISDVDTKVDQNAESANVRFAESDGNITDLQIAITEVYEMLLGEL